MLVDVCAVLVILAALNYDDTFLGGQSYCDDQHVALLTY